ncbi:aldehyde dehydrogenase family protein, partial [bacterium]|nr:aldehyde dehydrogenase family protein [bacterium]
MEPYKFLLGGEWKESNNIRKIINPYNGETAGEVCRASNKDAEDAIEYAEQAFRTFKKMPSYEKSNILLSIACKLKENKKDFSETITAESGKPIKLAKGEVERAVNTFTIASEEAKRINGELLSLDITKASKSKTGITKRFPIGPILGITPFNFPLNLAAHKIAPAIACGNPIILRPSSQCSITALKLGKIISESGTPGGCMQVLPSDTETGEHLARDARIKLITFTGSADVGFHLQSIAGKKKTVLELGGNAGVIVHSDADIERAAERCIIGGFGYAGQVCIAVQRIFVHQNVYENFMNTFIEKVKKTKTGDPMDESVICGPMIDEASLNRTQKLIDEASAEGAAILTGGKRNGTVFEPTVLTNVTPDMKVCSEELFAPAVTVSPYEDFKN